MLHMIGNAHLDPVIVTALLAADGLGRSDGLER
jgi:hypothetical protein